MKMKAVIISALALSLTGCYYLGFSHSNITPPSENRYLAAVKSWIGCPVEEVIQTWGPPSKIIGAKGGGGVYRWVTNEEQIQGMDYMYHDAVANEYITEKATSVIIACVTSLIVDENGIVLTDSLYHSDCADIQPPTSRDAVLARQRQQ